ncbi:TetR/AcrR family transcriptional regulator [Clostridium drakei]|uniref:TetR family transcriptional regulator n=1 Tax=Clostridium drakei TaxID=332101 RepID=A0A2U8DRC1_9CLOT|nr:TetR/AcrR family transcriptional regulator [Clostridium drakei]AWI04774.1 TetR family transcriptional regulator [Clostridium drakei]
MDKKELILNAMMDLLAEEKGATCSVSDIAKKAGIGKGSIYYYFRSKEEIFDALVERVYNEIIDKCKVVIDTSKVNAIEKLSLLIQSYRSSMILSSIDSYLHQQHNAAIHQKSLAKILSSLSPIITDIIKQGIDERLFQCDRPEETAEIILSTYCFLFDPGIFSWTQEQVSNKTKALADLLERGLMAPKGSMQFLCNSVTKFHL